MNRRREMFDFVKIEKEIDLNDLMTDNLQHSYSTNSGATYKLGAIDVKIKFIGGNAGLLTILGSLPYFFQGHNLYNSKNGTRTAIETVEGLIGIGLDDAIVKEFEYGVVVKTSFGTQRVFQSHKEIESFGYHSHAKRGNIATGVDYKKGDVRLKLYDPWANMKNGNKITSKTRLRLTHEGYLKKDNWIKFEMHSNKPHLLNEGRPVSVGYMLTTEFKKKCQQALLDYYGSIKKVELVKFPETKKEASVIAIVMTALLNKCDSVVEATNQVMNGMPPNAMTPQDRSARRRVIKSNLKKLSSGKCTYSIENLILEAFKE